MPESDLYRQPRCQRSAVVVLSPSPRETRSRNEPASNENETKQAAWEPEVRHIRPQQQSFGQKDLRQPALEFYARENSRSSVSDDRSCGMPSTPLFLDQHHHLTRLMTTPLEQRYDLKPGGCPSTKTVHRLKDPEPKRPSITLAHQKPPVGGRSPP
jgi:hypothetical protein